MRANRRKIGVHVSENWYRISERAGWNSVTQRSFALRGLGELHRMQGSMPGLGRAVTLSIRGDRVELSLDGVRE